MLTYALMLVLILCMVLSVVCGLKYDKDKDSFMSVDNSKFLRGFWCIVVVLVHIPAAYQNRMQDMIGSFAYIGVTFFFMTSAYGLKYSIKHKKDYTEHFWRRRLPAILLPALIANAFDVMMSGIETNFQDFTVVDFIDISNWVKVLLLMYFTFWLIYCIAPKMIRGGVLAGHCHVPIRCHL